MMFKQTAALVFMSVAFMTRYALAEDAHVLGCTTELGGYYYNLHKLSKPLDTENRVTSEVYNLEYEDVNGTASIQFNICEKTARQCPDEMNDYANVINGVGTCNHLSRTLESNQGTPGTLSLISEESPEMGVQMFYEGGNLCNETAHYSLTVQLNCNPNIDATTYYLDSESIKTPCDPKVIMNSPHACPIVTTGALGRFIDDYRYWIAAPMIILGAYLVSAGGRFPGFTLALFTTLAMSFGLLILLFVYILPYQVPSWTVWIVGFVSTGLGAGLGFGAAKWPKLGVAVMGASLGYLVGCWLYASIIQNSEGTASGAAGTKVAVILSMAIIPLALCLFFFDYAIIISSAVFGAYGLIRGISMIVGGYTNEFELVMATQNGEIGQVQWQMWIYWLFMIVTMIVAINMQLADRRKNMEAYAFKGYFNSNMESYKSNYDRITSQRNVMRRGADDRYYSDIQGNHGEDDYSGSSDQEDNQPLNNRRR